MACEICNHPHRRGLEMLLLESPHPVSRLSAWYELTEEAIEKHKSECMEEFK